MSKVLLVEDDRDLTVVVSEWLIGQGVTLEICHDGICGYELLAGGGYDIAVLDWDVPGMQGVDICRQYRADGGSVPILLLTGKGLIEDKMVGLEAGADDYLTKPFSLRELSARLRALSRRASSSYQPTLKVGKLEMDPTLHILWKDQSAQHLLPRDFAVLEFLMRHPNEVISSQDILRRVWSLDTEVSPDAVRTSIKRLRKKLDDGAEEDYSIIQTVSRVGYRLSAGM
ncbi:MAG: response regulator transcription factor [Cyanobacteria bacterium SZAS LIN-2]|nr:response regulator transcription factor [Cyanobacteria bacterium SZAS LIN-3]MBS1994912.1 response regulator transcription factor [Cyanobacteria bacterium SZAS LIN-2]